MTKSDQKETTKAISSGNAILMPGTPEYKTSLEQIYGIPGPPSDFQPVLDCLGRKIKEQDMPVLRGSLGSPVVEKGDRKVMVFRDHVLDFPELYLSVSIIGPPQDTRGFPNLFARAFCVPAKDLYDSDIVLFTGGLDVEPLYYNEEPHPTTAWDEGRDHSDIGIYMQCLDEGIPMIGVCRGAQFLAVMNGAKLFQDIDGHNGDHKMWDVKEKKMYDRVSSVHHQCVRPCEGMDIISVAHEATERWSNPSDCVRGRTAEIEAFYFRETCCLGVQGHPEYKSYNGFAQWFLNKIDQYVIMNEDLEWKDSRRRLKQEFIEERRHLAGVTRTPSPTLAVIQGDK